MDKGTTDRREGGRERGEAYLPPSCCRAPPPLRHEKIHFVFGNGAPAPPLPTPTPPSPSRFIIAFELTTRRRDERRRYNRIRKKVKGRCSRNGGRGERVGVHGSLVALQREIRLDRRRKEKAKDRMVTTGITATDRPTHGATDEAETCAHNNRAAFLVPET